MLVSKIHQNLGKLCRFENNKENQFLTFSTYAVIQAIYKFNISSEAWNKTSGVIYMHVRLDQRRTSSWEIMEDQRPGQTQQVCKKSV